MTTGPSGGRRTTMASDAFLLHNRGVHRRAHSNRDAARWRTFMDAGVTAVAIYEPDGTLKLTNKRMGEMWNVTDEQAAQLIGHYNILQDEQQRTAGLDGHIRRAFDGEVVDVPVTRYVVEPPGAEPYVKWVRGTLAPVLSADGETEEVVLTLLDVTAIESARENVEEQRQQAERQLHEIEHLYDASPIGLCLMDTDLRFVRVNARLAEINGVPKEEHIGRTLRDVLPELADRLEPLYHHVIETGRPIFNREIVGILARHSRERRSWMVSYHPLWDGEGELTGVGTVVQDISSIKQAEGALRDSEERFREMAAHIRDVFWLVDVSAMQVIYVSPAFEETWGRSAADLYEDASVWLEGVHPGDRDEIRGAFDAITAGGARHRCEYRVVRPDGEIRWISDRAYAVRDADGNLVRVAGIAEDITERRHAHEALRESEEHLRMLVNHAPAVLWAIDRDGRFTLSEGRALERLGFRPGEVVGRSVFEVYAGNTSVLDAARRALAGESVETVSIVDELIFETRYLPRFDGHGEVVGALGVAIDVTERERAAEERSMLERKVLESQRLESLGVLAGGIAHDFNNLLMGVLGSADLAINEMPLGSPGRQYLKQIETSAVRAAELTNQMLAYSGQGRFVVQPTCLNQVVQEMTDLLQTVISKKAELKLDLEHELPAVEADASQLRQVVMNLITNASEALQDRSGTILVRTGRREMDRGDVAACTFGSDLEPGPCVSLLVSDDGVGMDTATRRRIFDPFFTTKFTGRGLGLAGVLGIVRGHKGAVRVESTPGAGSSFEILLPAAVGVTALPETPSSPARVESARQRVLVADDDEMVLQVASLMLETAGFEVIVASDGQEAVEMFREQPDEVDLVLLDMTMPRLSGEEAFRELRALRHDVPVILSSGYTEQEARGRLEGEGVAGFVQKPYRAVDLLGEIQNVLLSQKRPEP